MRPTTGNSMNCWSWSGRPGKTPLPVHLPTTRLRSARDGILSVERRQVEPSAAPVRRGMSPFPDGNQRKTKKGAVMNATQSFAQDRGTGATPAEGAKAGATQGTFTTSDAIPWKPVDPKHPGLQMFAVWGNPNEGASLILQKFPAGMDSG